MRSLAILARWIWLPGAALSALAALLVVVATLDVEDTSALAANTGQLRVLAMSAANAALIGDRPGLDAAIQERRTRLESLHDPLQAVLGEEAATASLTLITAQFEVQERELLGGAIDSERLEQQTALIVTQVDGLLDALSETRDRRVDDIQRISVISTVLILAGGTVAAGAGVALQRRAQHAALAEQRIASQYESLITSMQNGLLLTDEHDRILYANRSLAEMLGVHPEQIIGQEASQLSPPAHREAATTRRRTVLLTGELDPPLLTHLLSERFGPLDVVATMTPIREGSRVAAVLSEYRNVTQETVLRAQVVDETTRAESILAATPVPIIVANAKGVVLTANAAVEATLGWSPAELIGQNVSTLMPDPFASHHAGYIAHYLDTGQASTDSGLVIGRARPAFALHRDGRQIPVSVQVGETRTAYGETVFTAVIHDLTESTDREAERLSILEQLLRDQRSVMLNALLAGAMHDFNNLLTALTGALDIEISVRGQSSRWLDHAVVAAQRAALVSRRLMATVRPGDQELEVCDVGAVVAEVIELTRETFDRRVRVEFHRSPSIPPVLADPTRVSQVVLNLMLNARDAVLDRLASAGPGYVPEIRVSVGRIGGSAEAAERVRIIVADDGCGIPSSDLRRVFDPFFTTKRKGAGTGLGMTMVREIVREMDATVELDSEENIGTSVTIEIPAFAGAEQVHEDTEDDAAKEILLIDPDGILRDVAVNILQEAGFVVRTAADIREAITEMDLGLDPAAIVLSSDEGGWESILAARKRDDRLPLVVMAGEHDARLEDLPYTIVLEKPFNPAALVPAVHRALSLSTRLSL